MGAVKSQEALRTGRGVLRAYISPWFSFCQASLRALLRTRNETKSRQGRDFADDAHLQKLTIPLKGATKSRGKARIAYLTHDRLGRETLYDFPPLDPPSTKVLRRKLAMDSVSFRGHSVCAVASARLLVKR